MIRIYFNKLYASLGTGGSDSPRDIGVGRWAQAVLDVMRECDGMGEVFRNNYGPYIDAIRRQAGLPKDMRKYGSWCAVQVSYAMEEGWARIHGAHTWEDLMKPYKDAMPIGRQEGARKLFRLACKHGARLTGPEPGALVLWDRGNPNKPDEACKAHIGVVDTVNPPGAWDYRAGNEGPFPAHCELHPGRTSRLVGFARLPEPR